MVAGRDQRTKFVILFTRARAAEPFQRLDAPIAPQELVQRHARASPVI